MPTTTTTAFSTKTQQSHQFILADYFYSEIRREFVDDYLKTEGDFLVRKSSTGQTLVISVFWKGQVRHCSPMEHRSGPTILYSFGKRWCASVEELIVYHMKNCIPFSDDHQTQLIRPVRCPKTKYKESDIEIVAKLGDGNFGEVFKVRIVSENQFAAMKTLKQTVSNAAREGFEKEMNMMKTMNHENVVRLIGTVQIEHGNRDEIRILLELINQGSLEKLLRRGKVTNRGKCKICIQVARGMAYLHTHHIIHRDLAARNVLVHRHDDGTITAKVSDFGLSRSDEGGKGYCLRHAQKMPLKWMAPESFLDRKWTMASDVWSFGILMWEVFSDGIEPYTNPSTRAPQGNNALMKYISDGNHPDRPNKCRDDIWQVMCCCWTFDYQQRLTMEAVVTQLEKIYSQMRQ